METGQAMESYSAPAWEFQRERIDDLYRTQGKTLQEVNQILAAEGFIVSLRALRRKVGTWKIGKNHKMGEMCTAFRLLSEYYSQAPLLSSSEPYFLVRDQPISIKEMKTYFRRKDIYDVSAWLAAQDPGTFETSPNVKLIQPPSSTTGARSDSALSSNTIQSSYASTPSEIAINQTFERIPSHSFDQPLTPSFRDALSSTGGTSEDDTSNFSHVSAGAFSHDGVPDWFDTENQSFAGNDQQVAAFLHKFPRNIGSPTVYRIDEKLISLSAEYILFYQGSPDAAKHSEPLAHRDTKHGIFGNQMQQGIAALLQRNDNVLAFQYFNKGCSMIKDLLAGNHPMAIAQVLAIVCELASTGRIAQDSAPAASHKSALRGMLSELLRYVAQACSASVIGTNPLVELLWLLKQADSITNATVKVLLGMVSQLSQLELPGKDPAHWKLLYLKERFCDCLYHAGESGSRKAARSELLKEQEDFYGPTRPNVLWTLTNVADDNLQSLNPAGAEKLYKLAFERATSLNEFSRAKTRFAALEGLARTALLKADIFTIKTRNHWAAGSSASSIAQTGHPRWKLLKEAHDFCAMAEQEGRKSFEADSRRTYRAAARRQELAQELAAHYDN